MIGELKDYCDRCRKKASRYYTSSSADEPTISLCRQCANEYEIYMRKAKEKFLSEKPQKNSDNDLDEIQSVSLKIGDKVKCQICNKPILLDENTFTADHLGEYIYCPHCKKSVAVEYYHLFGVKL